MLLLRNLKLLSHARLIYSTALLYLATLSPSLEEFRQEKSTLVSENVSAHVNGVVGMVPLLAYEAVARSSIQKLYPRPTRKSKTQHKQGQ